jgi:DNA-binding NtrC family response regulator
MPQAAKIQVVDADAHQATSLAHEFESRGHLAQAIHVLEGLSDRLRDETPDVLILDLEFQPGAALDFLRELKAAAHQPIVFATGGAPALRDVVEAVRLGARDVFEKPLFTGEIITAVENALRETRSSAQTAKPAPAHRPEIIGDAPALRDLLSSLELVTRAERATVLVQGESGTGKELIARAIHFDGPRANRPFLAVNCATLNENLLEAELFGYEKGAFTGALDSGKKGLFEAAHGGTLFLDEIGELAQSLQARLLRVLQEGAFKRVGGLEDIKTDVRIIAATNRELRTEVREGRFRNDLYFRLNVVPLRVPALRDRREDIDALARHFLASSAAELGKDIADLAPEALADMRRYDWPGNIRELRNVCEYAAIVCEGSRVERRHLTLHDVASLTPAQELEDEANRELRAMSLKEMEAELIEVVLSETRFNITRAAGILGINRSTLYNKMRDYGLQRDERAEMRQTV